MARDIYFKFFPKSLNLRGFQYKIGLNEDNNIFDPEPICSKGGLYYTDINHLESFKIYGEMIGIIKIPEFVPIVKVGNNKYKSPKIELIEVIKYRDFIENKDLYWEEKNNCTSFHHRELFGIYQTPETCLEAVKRNNQIFKYIRNQSPEICFEAVKRNGYNLSYVKEQTPELCLEAVKQNGYSLKFVRHQTPEICLEAVKQIGYCVSHVIEQTPEILLEAEKTNKRFIQ